MRRSALFLALIFLALLAGTAFASTMTPCAPPASGVAYPVGGGAVVPFHLAYVCVPPCLFWGAMAMGQAPTDSSTYSTSVLNPACPTTTVHFFEDESDVCWAQEETIPCDGPTVVRWLHVVTP